MSNQSELLRNPGLKMADLSSLRPVVLMRLQFIECLLANYGHINRQVLCDYFGISVPQASYDLNMYFQFAPKNAEYDKSARTYRKTQHFQRLWT